MTKLEQKLQELGYEYIKHNDYFKKQYSRFIYISIELDKDKLKVNDYGVDYKTNYLKKQSQIDNLQLAFNVMQKDLEVLKQYEL